MAASTYYGTNVEVYLDLHSDTPTWGDDTQLLISKECEISPEFEFDDLYGQGSILRQATARKNAKVNVKLSWCKFDPTVSTDSVLKILGTSGSIDDTTDVQLYDAKIVFNATDSSGVDLTVVVSNVRFEGVPFKASDGSWVTRELTGVGNNLTVTAGA